MTSMPMSPENRKRIRPLKLLFAADAALGYIEYCDFITYVRNFNSQLNPGSVPMRLMALGDGGEASMDIIGDLLGIAGDAGRGG